jgi:outer membrane biosynthesis protein TonB
MKMNRLQRKCFIASASIHGLLAVIILVGPGFMSSTRPVENLPILDFVPDVLVDKALMGGGNPNAKPPPPAPVAQPVQPTAPPVTPPQPKAQPKQRDPEPVEPVKNQTDSLEESPPKKRTPQISTTLKTRQTATKTPSKSTDESRSQERQTQEQQKRLASALTSAAHSLKPGTATDASITDVSRGPGGGGPVYASYLAWIQSVYMNAWVPPDDASVDAAGAYASITIERDGTIRSATLVGVSGDRAIDASVRRTLERVTTIGKSFPEGVKENERTYKLKFDLSLKRGTA